jgi:hypothetical protein
MIGANSSENAAVTRAGINLAHRARETESVFGRARTRRGSSLMTGCDHARA